MILQNVVRYVLMLIKKFNRSNRDFKMQTLTATGSLLFKPVGLRMSKVGIHAVLLPSATAKSSRSRSGEYVRICRNIVFEVLII